MKRDNSIPIDIKIRALEPSDSLDELTALLHRSYQALAEMGLRYMATHQDVDVTRRRIEKGTCYVAEHDKRIIATIIYYPPLASRGSPWLERSGVAHAGQLAVEPEFQRHGTATKLMLHCEDIARDDGADELALDTAEDAKHLIEWYERLGYRFVEYADWDVTNYRSVIMSKSL